jgi:hypothetical protein
VLVGEAAGDVERCQERKDIRLKTLNEKFEEGERDTECECKWADQLESDSTLQEVFAAKNKDHQEQVTSKHIRKETK